MGLRKYLVKKLGIKISPYGINGEDVEPSCAAPFQSNLTRLPAKVDLRPHCSEVENQGKTNSCTANAVVGAYEYLSRRDGNSGEVSRLFVYYVARTKAKMNPVADKGSSIGLAIDALKDCGACTEDTWPFDTTKVNSKPSAEAFEEAQSFTITKAVKVPLKEHDMKACLASGYPFVFGLKLTKRFMNPGPKGIVRTPDPADPQSSEHGRHAMLAVGYCDKQRVFIVRNSWSTNWGDKGYCYIPYDYMCDPNFNCSGNVVWAIHKLSDTDFSVEGGDDDEDVVDWDDEDEYDDMDDDEFEEDEEEEEEEEEGDDDGEE